MTCVASIAAEEFGHIELVSTAINTMLTGATDGKPGELGDLTGVKDARNTQHFIAGGAGALVQDSMGKPWNGDYVSASGDLIEDLTHNFFLETGARNNKLKVYEMVDHPAARALTGYLLVRGGVHQVAYARALENLTGADLMKLFPSPRIPTDKIPECQPHIKRGEHLKLYRFSPSDFKEIAGRVQRPAPGDRRGPVRRRGGPPRGRAAVRSPVPAGRVRARTGPGDARRGLGQAPQGGRPAGQADRRRRQRQGKATARSRRSSRPSSRRRTAGGRLGIRGASHPVAHPVTMATTRTQIAASPDEVFAALANPENYGDWVVGSDTIRDADPAWPKVGSRFHHRRRVGLAQGQRPHRSPRR